MRKKYEPNEAKPDFGARKMVMINNVVIISETAKAWLLKIDKDERKAFWVPKSATYLHTHAKSKRLHDLEIPEDLAEEKGLLDDEVEEKADKSIMDEFEAHLAERNRK